MKIQKLNHNTLKILLSVEELSLKNISIKDIESGKKKAQNFFFDIIENSHYSQDFLKENTKLLVEACVNDANWLEVIITKFEQPSTLPISSKFKKNITNYQLYAFYKLDELLEFVKLYKRYNFFVGTNSLYFYQNIYILIFSKSSSNLERFKKTYYTLTEYCDKYSARQALISYIKDNGELLISRNAVNAISCYILE